MIDPIDRICEKIEPQWRTLSRNSKENVRITVRETIKEYEALEVQIITLNDDEYDRFLELLDNPPKPNEALVRLMRKPSPWDHNAR